MDELKNEQVKTPAGGTVSNTNQQYINQMYDKQLDSQRAGLENAYNQSLAAAEQNQKQITQNYQTGANDLAAQYERNRSNFNQAALRNGINTGAYSQAELARQSQYQRDFGSLRAQEAMAQAQAGMQVANLKADYQTKIQQAVAENDYNRAAAMYKEFNEAQQRQQQNAAATGDYSSYVNMYLGQGYSPEEAQRMATIQSTNWIAANPDAALMRGMISYSDYLRMKSKDGTGGGFSGVINFGGAENPGTSYAPESTVPTQPSYQTTPSGQGNTPTTPKKETDTPDTTNSPEYAKWVNDFVAAGTLANSSYATTDQKSAYNRLVVEGVSKGYITPEEARAGLAKGFNSPSAVRENGGVAMPSVIPSSTPSAPAPDTIASGNANTSWINGQAVENNLANKNWW